MRKYIDVTGKTDEKAIEKALEELGLERHEVSVEILKRAKTGLFGIGSVPAEVRVWYNGSEESSSDMIPQATEEAFTPDTPSKIEEEEPTSDTSSKVEEEEPTSDTSSKVEEEESTSETSSKVEEEEPTSDTSSKVEEAESTPDTSSKVEEEESTLDTTSEITSEESNRDADLIEDNEIDEDKSQNIQRFLTGLLEHMNNEAVIQISQSEAGRYQVKLEGKNLGVLIGRRGETLDAIQQITGYVVNRRGSRIRVHMDIEGYREKREQNLRSHVQRIAVKAAKYRRSFTLEPMNSYERHVVHTALQDFKHVTTYSVGVEPNRRVVIAYDREKH